MVNYAEQILADIDAYYSNCRVNCLGHGALLSLAPACQLRSLGGAGARPDHSIAGPAVELQIVRALAPEGDYLLLDCFSIIRQIGLDIVRAGHGEVQTLEANPPDDRSSI